ncbi:hypothetical protein DY000_02030722 [Brassica cretica]|uniref:Uncharacterized protein n=1 Tax=Brassica cretica TaxID=69181 RepID=A0ABQ7DXQ9_BRACR|nr:hypothetical protein DY000_02030722 [Brassica cretica]
MWEFGVSPLDPKIVSGPGGLVRTGRSFGNPEALRSFQDPETAWGPEGIVLRLPRQDCYRYLLGFRILPIRSWPLSSSYPVFYFCRKSLTGLEGSEVSGDLIQLVCPFKSWDRDWGPEAMYEPGDSLTEPEIAGWNPEGFVGYKPIDEDGLLGAKPFLGGYRIGNSYVLEYFLYLSDLGRFPLVQAGIQTRRKGPRPGGMNPRPGGRKLDAGSWRNNMVFFIGIRALHRSIKLLVEFGVGRRLVAWAIKLPCIDVVNMLQWACVRSLVVPLIPMTWKWIIRKNHHDETLPPWCRLVGVGRRFDGEAGNVCIKGDSSAHTPDSCAAPEFMGQDPGILRGKILARRRIRGMRRFNKPRRPKLRILMLDPAGLACAS